MFLSTFATDLIQLIAKSVVYIFSVTIVGCLHAWIISMLGDPTPKEEGAIALDPFLFIDGFGFLSYLFIGWGWSKGTSFSLWRLPASKFLIRLAGILFSRVILHWVIAFLAYISFFLSNSLLVHNSSLIETLSMLFAGFTGFNISLGCFVLLMATVQYAAFCYKKYQGKFVDPETWDTLSLMSFYIALAISFFFGRFILAGVFYMLHCSATSACSLLGLHV